MSRMAARVRLISVSLGSTILWGQELGDDRCDQRVESITAGELGEEIAGVFVANAAREFFEAVGQILLRVGIQLFSVMFHGLDLCLVQALWHPARVFRNNEGIDRKLGAVALH